MKRLGAMIRRLMGSPAVTALLAALASFYIWLVLRTVRWQKVRFGINERMRAEGRGFIAAMWHGRLFMSPTWAPEGFRTVAVISNNRDGELITRIVRRWNVDAVRGSTYDRAKRRDKGGREVYQAGLAELREGCCLAITPDGPRGPRMRAQPGAALLSIEAGAALVPVAFATRRARLTRGWDRFMVPLPFDRGVYVMGEPLRPPSETDAASVEAYRARIEAAITEVTNEADRLCGRAPVPPDPRPAVPA